MDTNRWPGPVVDDVRQMTAELVGCTPLVRLDAALVELGAGIGDGVQVWGKVEWANPLGSVKDRPVLAMVRAAMGRGELAAGMRVVEATSGNTGLALAGLCAAWGMGCTLVVPDKVSAEKVAALRALGAEVVICDTAAAPGTDGHYQSVAAVLGAGPGCWRPSQYDNADNPRAHRATAEEIWAQTGGAVSHVVAGVGTGGTLCGLAAAFTTLGRVRAVCADPVGSSLTGGDGGGWLVEGIGEDEVPGNFDDALVDDYVAVEDAESIRWCRTLSRSTGLWLGGSSGTAVAAAVAAAGDAPAGSVIVAVLADGGRAYLSKVYDDHWCAARGFDTALDAAVWDRDAATSVGQRIAGLTFAFDTGPWAGPGRWVVTTDRDRHPRVGSVRSLAVDGIEQPAVFCGVGERAGDVAGRGRWLAVCDRGRVVAVAHTDELAGAARTGS